MAEKKTLVRFNVKNIKYALKTGDRTYDEPKEYGAGLARSMALEPDSSVKKIYGDGRRICSIVNDRGKTGTMGTNNISDGYETDMGRKLKTKNGLAEIRQRRDVEHAIYFETEGFDEDGKQYTAKTWLYGCHSTTPPSESYEQNTDEVNESTFETALEINGETLVGSDKKPYKDDKGNIIEVWQMTVTPEDEGYDTYGDAVVLPEMPDAQE